MRLTLFAALLLTACQPSLERQPRIKPYSEGALRSEPEHTLAREDGSPVKTELKPETLHEGQSLYAIHCAVCHGFSGKGDGMAVQRGFPKPEALDKDLKSTQEIEVVIRDGRGKMFGLGNRLTRPEREKIAFYVRALALRAHPPKGGFE